MSTTLEATELEVKPEAIEGEPELVLPDGVVPPGTPEAEPEPPAKRAGKAKQITKNLLKMMADPLKKKEKTDEQLEAEREAEKKIQNEKIDAEFLKSFPDQFKKEKENEDGTKEKVTDMSKLEGLSWEQKTLLLQRMQGFSAKEAKLRARDMFELDKKEAKSGKGFWGKIGNARKSVALSFTKNAKLLEYEKKALSYIKKDDADLEAFRSTVENREIEMHKGQAHFNYFKEIGFEEPIFKSEEESTIYYAKRSFLNDSANEFANIPEEWSMPEAPKELQKKYQEAKSNLEYAKTNQMENLIANGMSEKDAGVTLAQIEERMNMDRLMTSKPRMQKAFAKIENGKIWKKYFTGYVQDNGQYMVGGGALRKGAMAMAAVPGLGLASIIAAPVIAGAIGYLRGQKRTRDDLAYEAGNRRRDGINSAERSFDSHDEKGNKIKISRDDLMYTDKKEAQEIAKAYRERMTGQLPTLKAEIDAETDADKKIELQANYDEVKRAGEFGGERLGGILKLKYSVERIQKKIDASTNQSDIAFWRVQLENRLDYTRAKVEKGEIVFAVGKKGIEEKLMLNYALSESAMKLATTDSEIQEEIRNGLSQKFEDSEDKNVASLSGIVGRANERTSQLRWDTEELRDDLKKAENKYVVKQALKSAGTGALFGFAGAGLSQWLWGHHTPDGNGLKEALKTDQPEAKIVAVKEILKGDSATTIPSKINISEIDSTYVAKHPSVLEGSINETIKNVKENITTPKVENEVDLSHAVVAKGDGVTSGIVRDIESNTKLAEQLGYKEGMDLHKFAIGKSAELAKAQDYIRTDGSEVHLTKEAIGHSAYKVEVDASGKASIHEYLDGKKVVNESDINNPYEELVEKKIPVVKEHLENIELAQHVPSRIPSIEESLQQHMPHHLGDTEAGKIPLPTESEEWIPMKHVDYATLPNVEPQFKSTIGHIFDSKFLGITVQKGVNNPTWLNVKNNDAGYFLTQKMSDKKMQALANSIRDLQSKSGINPSGYSLIDYVHVALAKITPVVAKK